MSASLRTGNPVGASTWAWSWISRTRPRSAPCHGWPTAWVPNSPFVSGKRWGALLRGKRNAASFSRVQLARKAKLSDATIEFLETARHLPIRSTLILLVSVEALKLSWADIPGKLEPPSVSQTAAKQPESDRP